MGELYKRLRKLSHTEPPSLPGLEREKTFHIFFWYDHKSEDETELINDIKQMLDDRYDNEVKYFDRDQFLPGQSIWTNYVAGIKNSLKIIILVTKNFHRNGIKEYVTELALYNRRPKYAVIPLLHKTELPDLLKPLIENTVDLNDGEDKWWKVFLIQLTKKIEISGMLNDVPNLPDSKTYHFTLLCDTEDEYESDLLLKMKEKRHGTFFKYKLLEIPTSSYTSDNLLNRMNEILKLIELSVKFVLYLSEKFSSNGNCRYLAQLVKMVMQDIRLQGGYVIPVVCNGRNHIEWFEKLFERNIQYLEITRESMLWRDRLIDSLARTEIFEQSEPKYFIFPGNNINPCECNVPRLFELSSKSKGCCRAKVFRVSEFNCKQDHDTEPTRLLDLCFRNDNDILVIDAGNNKLKRYTFSGLEKCYLLLNGMPNRMTYLKDDIAAIIYEFGSEVICINTTSMEYDKIIVPSYGCLRGIIHLGDEAFALTVGEGPMEFCLLEPEKDGTFVQTIINAHSKSLEAQKDDITEERVNEISEKYNIEKRQVKVVGNNTRHKDAKVVNLEAMNMKFSTESVPRRRLINMPRRLAYSKRRGQIVIADENDRQLIYFNKDSYEMSTREKWKGLYNLRGIATDGDRIYVAASNSILVYDFEGKNIYEQSEPLIEMKHDVYHTRAVAIDKTGSYLAVTQATKQRGQKREIVRVFKV